MGLHSIGTTFSRHPEGMRERRLTPAGISSVRIRASVSRGPRIPSGWRLNGIGFVRSRDAGAWRDADTLDGKALFERREEEQDVGGPAGVAHETNAPGLPLEIAQSAADLDAELAQKALARVEVVGAGRDLHGVELRQFIPLARGIADAECRQ